jgi:predicted permease
MATVFQSIVPVFLVIALGFVLRRSGFLPPSFFDQLNKLVFWVGLPAMLYGEIASAPVPSWEALRVPLMLMVLSTVLIPVSWIAGRALSLPLPAMCSFVQAAVRGNLAYVGLPIVVSALAADPQARTSALLTIAPTIPFYNILGVLVLVPAASAGRGRQAAGKALVEIARNPLVLACLLGLASSFAGIRMPSGLGRCLDTTGKIGLPGALLAVGAGLDLGRVRGQFGATLIASLVKVAVLPAIGWATAGLFGLHGAPLTMAMLYLSCPTAVATYVMADQMGADRELAAGSIVLSTLLAFPAMAAILLLLA